MIKERIVTDKEIYDERNRTKANRQNKTFNEQNI